MKRDNRGLSLVEVIIVLAILAVMSGIMILGIGAAMSKPAEECMRKIEESIKSVRVATMGKQSIQLKIYADGNSVYVQEVVNGTPKNAIQISSKGVDVSYRVSGSSAFTALGGESSALVISFDRSTGGFNPLTPGSGIYCEEIKVVKGTREHTMTFYSPTGKVTVQ